MNAHPLVAVETAAAEVQEKDALHRRRVTERNRVIAGSHSQGMPVAEMVRLTGLARPTIYAAMKAVNATDVNESVVDASASLVAARQAEVRAAADLDRVRQQRDGAICDAHRAGVPAVWIARAAGIQRTQLYRILRQYDLV